MESRKGGLPVPNDAGFFDLPEILALRQCLRSFDPAGPPAVQVVQPPAGPGPRRLAWLPGSFNPPTDAHLALARSALSAGRVDALEFLLATRTVNKEQVEGASLTDRLLCLRALAAGTPDEGVVVVNRGLYVDQAGIAHAAFPDLEQFWFVVGFDKIVQIFDPRYYTDLRAALDRLFALASFLVAPRDDAGPAALAALKQEPTVRPYADQVIGIELAPPYRSESSTRVRAAGRAGQPLPDVPPVVRDFVAETGAYQAPRAGPVGVEIDRYALREQVIDLVEAGSLPILAPAQFRALVARLAEPVRGAPLRQALAQGRGADLLQLATREQPW
jgi:nicotinamide-nucleotide adenylyltransferase